MSGGRGRESQRQAVVLTLAGCERLAGEWGRKHQGFAPPITIHIGREVMAMSDSNEGAVCGTCGGTEGAMYDATGGALLPVHPDVHPFTIPAPVVPSDERRQCWEVFSTTAIGASVIKWHCKLEKGHDGDHMGAQIHAAAPPTHSQDAEGGGLYRYEESMGARCCITCLALPGEPHADGCHALALVSSIRADYEELVKAARDARSALVLLTSELSGQMGYIEGLQQRPHGQPQRTINYAHDVHAFLTATLTRIEESLGGRS